MQAFRSFQIDWRAKAAAFRLLDRMPYGNQAYYHVQRRVTRTIPRRMSPTKISAHWFVEHANALATHAGSRGIGSLSVFEFGAGWDLYSNCVAWSLGVARQTVFDLTRWARGDQINVALAHLRADPPADAIRVPQVMLCLDDFEKTLSETYGIDYHAPADAGDTGLPDGTFDAVITTSVLEHIAPSAILRILRECHRLLPQGAIMSHVIDYSDHYAHSDATITPYNFLSFEQRSWDRFNPGIHYQNRLRHADYAGLFESAGFRVVSDSHSQPDNADQVLAGIKLSQDFAERTSQELAPLIGHYILQRI